MKLKELWTDCSFKVSKFLNKNGDVIAKSFILAVVSVLIKELGLSSFTSPSLYSVDSNNDSDDSPENDCYTMPPAENPAQQSIVGLWKAGMSSSYASIKTNCMTNIYKIASTEGVDADTIQYAIMAISKIGENTSYASAKMQMSTLISSLATLSIAKGATVDDSNS